MRDYRARECGVTRGCSHRRTRALRVTLPLAVPSSPMLRVGPTEPCLGLACTRALRAPLRRAGGLPLRYAGAATARSRGEASSQYGCCMPPLSLHACAIVSAEPHAGSSHGRGHYRHVDMAVALPYV